MGAYRLYGLAIGVPSSAFGSGGPDRGPYLAERRNGESFKAFVQRIGKAESKKMIDDLTTVPMHDVDPSFYTDWADAREYTTGDMSVGECAGEVVRPVDFALTASEREAFEAQLQLEAGDTARAASTAYGAMLHAAQALVRHKLAYALRSLTRWWLTPSFTTRGSSSIPSRAGSLPSISSTPMSGEARTTFRKRPVSLSRKRNCSSRRRILRWRG